MWLSRFKVLNILECNVYFAFTNNTASLQFSFKNGLKTWNMPESDTSVGSNKPKESFMRRSTRRMSMIWVQNEAKKKQI